jgi:hypothetical protein
MFNPMFAVLFGIAALIWLAAMVYLASCGLRALMLLRNQRQPRPAQSPSLTTRLSGRPRPADYYDPRRDIDCGYTDR